MLAARMIGHPVDARVVLSSREVRVRSGAVSWISDRPAAAMILYRLHLAPGSSDEFAIHDIWVGERDEPARARPDPIPASMLSGRGEWLRAAVVAGAEVGMLVQYVGRDPAGASFDAIWHADVVTHDVATREAPTVRRPMDELYALRKR